VKGTLAKPATLCFAIIALALPFHIAITSSHTAPDLACFFYSVLSFFLYFLSAFVFGLLRTLPRVTFKHLLLFLYSSPHSTQSTSFFSDARNLEKQCRLYHLSDCRLLSIVE
jgi:hypothetical protein